MLLVLLAHNTSIQAPTANQTKIILRRGSRNMKLINIFQGF